MPDVIPFRTRVDVRNQHGSSIGLQTLLKGSVDGNSAATTIAACFSRVPGCTMVGVPDFSIVTMREGLYVWMADGAFTEGDVLALADAIDRAWLK